MLVQLIVVAAGVLLALLCDGLVEWRHNVSLVREARLNILQEIQDNKKAIDGELQGMDKRARDVATALRLADELLRTGKSDVREIDLGMSLADLTTASWESAARMGALGLMRYDDVRSYSEVYEAQRLYQEQQRRTFEHLSAALSIASVGDPHTAEAADLRVLRGHVLTLRADLLIQGQLGQRLSEIYATRLGRR